MKLKHQKILTLTALLGVQYWFFGNLYEQVVIAPNWIVNSIEQMRRLNEFFVNTSPTHYFVPVTQIATILVWILFILNKVDDVKKDLKRASIYMILDTAITILIVSTIVMKLFGVDYIEQGDNLNTLTWRWNILNVFRMIFTALISYYLFNAFRKLDKLDTEKNNAHNNLKETAV